MTLEQLNQMIEHATARLKMLKKLRRQMEKTEAMKEQIS